MPHFATNPKFGRRIFPVGGLGGKVRRVMVLRQGKDALAQCARSLVSFLGIVWESYDEKGGDANVEAEAELMVTTAVSVKQPYRTVLSIALR